MNWQARDKESGICLGQRSAHVFREGQRVNAVGWGTKRQNQGCCEILDTRWISTVLLGQIHNLTVECSFCPTDLLMRRMKSLMGAEITFPFTEFRMGAPVSQISFPTLTPSYSPVRFHVFHLWKCLHTDGWYRYSPSVTSVECQSWLGGIYNILSDFEQVMTLHIDHSRWWLGGSTSGAGSYGFWNMEIFFALALRSKNAVGIDIWVQKVRPLRVCVEMEMSLLVFSLTAWDVNWDGVGGFFNSLLSAPRSCKLSLVGETFYFFR